MARNVSIRLGTEGKAQIKADLDEIAATGDATAKRWARAYDNATRDVEAALVRQQNAMAKASMYSGGLNPTKLDSFAGVNDNVGKSAQSSAAVFEASYRQMEARAKALVSAIDPVYAAQQRFDREMVNAKTLMDAGVLSADRYAQVEKRLADELQEVTLAHGRAGVASGAHRAAMQGLSYQVQDTFTQLSMGANPLQVLAIQGGQAAGQMTGLGGAAGKFANFMIGPWGLALTGGALLLGGLTKGMFDNEEASKKAEAALAAFASRQSDIGNFIDATTGKLKEQNRTLVLNAILTRQAQIAENNKQIAEGRGKAFDRANSAILRATNAAPGTTTSGVSFTDDTDVQKVIRNAGGDVTKLSDGLARLAKTRPELAKVALEVSGIGGQAILAQRDNVKLGIELRALNGDTAALAATDKSMIEARAKLAGATSAMDRAQAQYTISIKEADAAYERSKKTEADRARLLTARTAAERALNVAQDSNRKGGEAHAQSLARQASAMEVNASAALDLARAYLEGGDAALRAEAARKGLTDATRKGIDSEAQVQRQLAIMVGDQVANGAKNVAQLREEAKARADVLAQVAAGTLPVDQMNQALADEAALRPLLKLQMVAQGDALKALNTVIDAYRDALKNAHEQEANFGLEKALSDSIVRVEEIKSSIREMSMAPLDAALDQAKRAAVREADANRYTGDGRTKFIDSRVAETEQQYYANRARFVRDTLNGQQDNLALAQRELQLAGANDNFRTVELDKLRLILKIRSDFPDMARQDVQSLLDGVDALSKMEAELARTTRSMDELRGFGSDFVDTVLSEDTWSSWGNAGKQVLGMIRAEFMKLVLINPLKNLINGNSDAPTIGGVIGSISKLFGGASSIASVSTAGWGSLGTAGSAAGTVSLPKLASGTAYWSGGAALLGEHGPEIASLPVGTRVAGAGDTRRLFSGNDNVPRSVTHNHFTGNLLTPEFWKQIQAGDEGAAVRGAAGGAAMSEAESGARAQRKLGRW